ncbi:MAG TPA: SMC family ATPase [Bacilli bacterium]|nr:SMC family ATPase [Bacilli bacterium]
MRLQALEVEAFRGFVGKRRFELAGVQVLVVHGPNGHGKTSFFDALEWALTGEIYRYREASDERKRARFVGNLTAGERGWQPRVRLELLDEQGRKIVLTRQGTASEAVASDYGQSELELELLGEGKRVRGEEAEAMLRRLLIREDWQGKVELGHGLQLTHLLGQEQINRFLRGLKGKERYQAISVLAGTEDFSRYKGMLEETKRELTERVKAVEAQIQAGERVVEDVRGRLGSHSDKEEALMGQVGEQERGESASARLASCLERLELLATASVEDLPTLRRELESHLLQAETTRRDLQSKRLEPLRRVREELPLFQKEVQVLAAQRQRLALLEQAQKLKRDLHELGWLVERHEEYVVGERDRELLQRESRELQRQAEEAVEAYRCLKKTREELERAVRLDEGLEEWLGQGWEALLGTLSSVELSSAPVEDVEREAFGRWRSAFEKLHLASKRRHELEEEFEASLSERNQWEQEAKKITALRDQYHQLLHAAREYVHKKDDLTSCPVCGTSPVSETQILEQIRAGQVTLDPGLPLIEQSVERAKDKCARIRAELEANEQETAQARAVIGKGIERIDGLAAFCLQRNKDLLEQASLCLQRVESVEELWESFQQKAQQLGIDPAGGVDRERLYALEEQLKQQAHTVLEALPEQDQTNLPLALEDCRQKIEQAEGSRSRMMYRLEQVGASVEQVRSWSGAVEGRVRDGAERQEQRLTADMEQFVDDAQERAHILEARLQERERDVSNGLAAIAVLQSDEEKRRMREHLQREQAHLSQLAEKRTALHTSLDAVKEAIRAVPQAIDRLNGKLLTNLFASIQEIFARLNSHPIYRTLDFSRDLRYGSNSLTFQVEEGVNPSFIFSSAQVNSIALSFFLAMALQQQWSPWRLIAMDDPVQSMDDLNVAALVDLLRVLSDPEQQGRQIVISTHDPQFYSMMRRKFRYRTIGVIEYEGYGEDGPTLRRYENEKGEVHYVRRLEPQPMPVLPSDLLTQRTVL